MKKLNPTLFTVFLLCGAALAACSTSGGTATAAPPPSAQAMPQETQAQEAQPQEAQGTYRKITAQEAKAMLDKGDVTVVDVRRSDEYAAGHIPGSILVPNEEIGDTQPEELPDLDAVLLVHCRTGIRSRQASDKLIKLGYTNVYDFGGIADWPYDTVTE